MKIFKKIAPLALVLSMIFTTFTPVLAAVDEYQNMTEIGTGNTEVFYNQESSFGVTIPKKITLDADKTSDYTVTVTGDISSDEIIFVVPDESFLMKDQATTGTIKNDVTATVEQDKTEWKFNEFETIGNGLVSAPDLTAGNWAGTFYFNVKFNDCNITVNATDENGENLNATATNIVGKEKDALLEKLVESELISEDDEVSALINVKSDNFDGIADTTFNVSNIAKEGEKVAILHFDETNSKWELIGIEEVDENGEVKGDFTSYSPVAFVKVNPDGSYTIPLDAGLYDLEDNLIYTWEELIEKKLIGLDKGVLGKIDNSLSGKLVLNNDVVTISSYTYARNIDEIVLSSSVKLIQHYSFWGCKISKITFAEGLEEINGSAFRECNNLTELNFPASLKTLGYEAFYKCVNLKKVTFKEGIETIGKYAFCNCTGLTEISLPEGVKTLVSMSFGNCSNLTTINLPSTVETIDDHAFYCCGKLSTINYAGTEEQWNTVSKIGSWKYGTPKDMQIIYNYQY